MAETPEQWKTRMGIGRPNHVAQLVGGPGTARTAPVHRDNAPGIAGHRQEHWDGRTDATVTHPIIRMNPNLRASS